ncbi:probable LRR receptor-like serine/threonine-protein kinase RFK1 isoform X4 [Helianthus annuus]|uniref:probable LRR receptor-like serine/threonine-protein kinase RFK1 isoform X4 n=1 Tax=Helianthus annuus TaxID=4232 RepID=UPI001652CF73|nr:probable LRR receptor-like serine/threonine-protein kinase RFK1 isoform X4 [Helianthus annuus]
MVFFVLLFKHAVLCMLYSSLTTLIDSILTTGGFDTALAAARNLEASNFSGTVPSDLGRLINLHTLILSSNRLTGTLPASLAELSNLKDFRIIDNNLSGSIPNFIENWRQLNKLRTCELSGPTQRFPPLDNVVGLLTLYVEGFVFQIVVVI